MYIFFGSLMSIVTTCDGKSYQSRKKIEGDEKGYLWMVPLLGLYGKWSCSNLYFAVLWAVSFNIPKNLCRLCYWAADPLIDRFY